MSQPPQGDQQPASFGPPPNQYGHSPNQLPKKSFKMPLWGWGLIGLFGIGAIANLVNPASGILNRSTPTAAPVAEKAVPTETPLPTLKPTATPKSQPTTRPTPTIKPTEEPKPTATAKPIPTTLPTTEPSKTDPTLNSAEVHKGIGVSRNIIQSAFEKKEFGFKFTRNNLADGRVRTIATAKNGLTVIELIGPDNNLERAYLMGVMPSDNKQVIDQNSLYMTMLLTLAAPNWPEGNQWLINNITQLKNKDKIDTSAGNLKITVEKLAELGALSLTVEEV